MPSQNDGTASPAIENMRMTWSIQVFFLTAESVPSGIAMQDRGDRRHDGDLQRELQRRRSPR